MSRETIAPWRAALRSMRPDERADLLRSELLKRGLARRSAGQFDRYRDDLPGFSRDILGVDPWDAQAEVMSAVTSHRHVLVRSGQKIGKSKGAACVALGWVATRKRGMVVLTSGNSQQVRTILWRELRKVYEEAGCARTIGGTLHKQPQSGLEFDDGRLIVGLTADDAERIAGYSGDELLFIIDEASGFDDELHEAIEGNLGGGGHELALGNPTRTTGWFAQGFKSAMYRRIHIDSRESPNVKARRKIVPGLATHEYVEEMRAKYGEDHPVFQVRVAGNFPKSGALVVISLESVERALARYEGGLIDGERVPAARLDVTQPLHLGIDVARFGDDDSVIQGRRGKVAIPSRAVHGFDVVQVAGAAVEYVDQHRAYASERAIVKIDGNGVGAGVVDLLRQRDDMQVVDVNAGSSATDESCVRMRDQLWWAVREWLADGAALPPDLERDEELQAPTYSFDARQRIQVESKDSIKKRLKRSPDRADALALAVLEVPAGDVEIETGATRQTASLRNFW